MPRGTSNRQKDVSRVLREKLDRVKGAYKVSPMRHDKFVHGSVKRGR